jgi:hypothetical protein
MIKTLDDIEAHSRAALLTKVDAHVADVASKNCAWLHGAGYNGLKYLVEALHDDVTHAALEPDAMGLDLKSISCVFLSKDIEALRATHGRLFLRNVRHGLYLLPASVLLNYGIGCPVDPAFALGGERTKNPYTEKMELAVANGVEVDDTVWKDLEQA